MSMNSKTISFSEGARNPLEYPALIDQFRPGFHNACREGSNGWSNRVLCPYLRFPRIVIDGWIVYLRLSHPAVLVIEDRFSPDSGSANREAVADSCCHCRSEGRR